MAETVYDWVQVGDLSSLRAGDVVRLPCKYCDGVPYHDGLLIGGHGGALRMNGVGIVLDTFGNLASEFTDVWRRIESILDEPDFFEEG